MLNPIGQHKFSKPGLIRAEVYEHLKLEIVQGRLPGGERLAEENIAASLGVSRTPVREAVQRLAQDGFVELIPNKGARVRSLSSQEIIQTYAVREALEGLAARLAAEHRDAKDLDRLVKTLAQLERLPSTDYAAQTAADLEFHAAIASASKNVVLQASLRGLRDTIARAKVITRKTNQATQTKLEHQAILKQIQNGDADAAEESARAHVRRFQKIVLEELGGKE
jgi:DNA-binding GntR family transcriptional regulator